MKIAYQREHRSTFFKGLNQTDIIIDNLDMDNFHAKVNQSF